jgi:exodeoxyribonuclease VII large subunit
MVDVLGRRWPLARVRLYPVLVQGVAAATEIRAAVQAANRHGWADVLILGRGGGSLEDLAAFNDESVARAVSASALPVVSAVGHETDFSICDFVADLRAPTPSAAAELATPDQVVLRESYDRAQRMATRRIEDRLRRDTQRLDHLAHRLQQRHPATLLGEQQKQLELLQGALLRNMRQQLEARRSRLEGGSRRLGAHRPDLRLAAFAQRVITLRRALDRVARNELRLRQERLRDLVRTLHAVSPLDVIARGYAVLTAPDSGAVISSVRQVKSGDRLDAQLTDGKLHCTVD